MEAIASWRSRCAYSSSAMPRASASAASCLSISELSSTLIVMETSHLHLLSDGSREKVDSKFDLRPAARSTQRIPRPHSAPKHPSAQPPTEAKLPKTSDSLQFYNWTQCISNPPFALS